MLPYQGDVQYFGCALPPDVIDKCFENLAQNVKWQHDEVMMFGKVITTKRKIAWYADQAYSYTYAKKTKVALPWIPDLIRLKDIVEELTGERYNSCLLNLYHNGSEGMGWHCDNEPELKPNGAIASLSLGAERNFNFKHKTTKETRTQRLEHGSLLVMKGQTQEYWLHSLPVSKKIEDPRINLTFRTIQVCEQRPLK